MKGSATKLITFLLALVLCAAFMLPGCSMTDKPADKGEAVIQQNMHIANLLAVRQDNLLYFTESPEASRNTMIYVLDLTSGEVAPLCSKPECTHEDKECGGYFDFNGEFTYPTIYNGELYWTWSDYSSGARLYKQSLDGTDRKAVIDLNPEIEKYRHSFCGIYDNALYRCGSYFDEKNGEPIQGVLVYSQELEKGSEPKEIYRLEVGNDTSVWTLARMNEGTLYFSVFRTYSNEEGAVSERVMDLYAYDMMSGELNQLYSGGSPASVWDMFYRDGKLIFHVGYDGNYAAFSYSLEKGKLEKIYGSAAAGSVAVGDKTMLELVSMTGYRVLDPRGNVLFEGEVDRSLFHEDRQAKWFIGSVDDVYYYYENSMGGEEVYNYLVSYDGNTGESRLVWENRGRAQGE